MAKTPFNAKITKDASYTVPTGKVAEFNAFGAATVTVDGVKIVNQAETRQVGPIVAAADAVIGTDEKAFGISGYLMDPS